MKKSPKKVPLTPGLGDLLVRGTPRKGCTPGNCKHLCKIGWCTLNPHNDHWHTSKGKK